MGKKIIYYILYTSIYFLAIVSLNAQNCIAPFSISFKSINTQSVDIAWLDGNSNVINWEIELVQSGNTRTFKPTISSIKQTNITISNLQPSTAYELYIRALCGETTRSNWNLVSFKTALANPTSCKIDLALKDNGTETFMIDIKESGILGKDIYLEAIDMIVKHEWPADLKISLVSPQGTQLVLSDHNGTVTDDFGDTNRLDCERVTSFNINACESLKQSRPPYIGSFKPDQDIQQFAFNQEVRGIWRLVFFDRAIRDVGTLQFVNLKFNREQCIVPSNFNISNITKTSALLDFDTFVGCKTIKLLLTADGLPEREIIFNCNELNFMITGLIPNTNYTASILANCTATNSTTSCKIAFQTSCESVSLATTFDNTPLCESTCNSTCILNNNIWKNVSKMSSWIVWKGKTNTNFTGPSDDITIGGHYLYVESDPAICTNGDEIILESSCILVQSNPSGCDFSFYHHSYGQDITDLSIQISTDDGISWSTLSRFSGDLGDKWIRRTISLAGYHNKVVKIRFVTTSAIGILGDIALDQIEFYGSRLSTLPIKYYVDKDGDGFGIASSFIERCSSDPLTGYSLNFGDCDDENANINPNATEIPCNGLDENCNGNTDDLPINNPITFVIQKNNPSCNGSLDGSITLNTISGGTAPYTILWSTGATTTQINGLKSGVYFGTIKDSGGCIANIPFTEIKSTTTLNAIVSQIDRPTCKGKNDGNIIINHNDGLPPYNYQWSNGLINHKNLLEIGEGIYALTITDTNGCFVTLENIIVQSLPAINSNILVTKNPLCYGDKTGALSVIATGGRQPYTYQWNNGKNENQLDNLRAGSYKVTITDVDNCISIATAIISENPKLEAILLSTEGVRCHNENNGSIRTKAIGGKPPYTFIWNNFDLGNVLLNAPAGSYALTITDSQGCKDTLSPIVVSQPEPLIVNIDTILPSVCLLGDQGKISIQTTGGTPAYNYAWGHSSLSQDSFENIPSGTYSVTAYDLYGCKASIPNIFVPFINKDLRVTLEKLKDNVCNGINIGTLSARNSDGELPIDYNWSNGVQRIKNSSMDTISNLKGGKYSLTITDAQGCIGNAPEVEIKTIPPFFYQVEAIKNNICSTDSIASIDIKIIGGTMPTFTSWNNGSRIGNKISNLPDGIYRPIITDDNGCLAATSDLTITSLSDIKITSLVRNEQNSSKNGEICITITGGTLPYQIKWSNNTLDVECIKNLIAGVYQVTIVDGLGCMVMADIMVSNSTQVIEIKNHPNLNVYPNPFQIELWLNSSFQVAKVIILGSDGKIINILDANSMLLKTENEINTYHIQTNDILPGVYYAKIVLNNGESHVYKIVKI